MPLRATRCGTRRSGGLGCDGVNRKFSFLFDGGRDAWRGSNCNRLNRRGSRSRNGSGGLLACVRLHFARGGNCSRRRGMCNRRLDDHGGRRRRDHDYGTRRGNSTCRSLGNDRASGRVGGNCRRSRWHNDDGRRGARLGNDFARRGTGRRNGRRDWGCGRRNRGRRGGLCLLLWRSDNGRAGRTALARFQPSRYSAASVLRRSISAVAWSRSSVGSSDINST